MPRHLPKVALAALLCLAACAPILPSPTQSPTSPSASPTEAATAVSGPTTSGPMRLTIWLPPQLDPTAGTPAADLLQMRLDEFGQQHPELQLTVRVKAEAGPGGLLESVRAASEAAPSALPDLIVLPPAGLHSAALKGLIYPLEALVPTPEPDIWYPHAVESALIDGVFFGLPIGSDALIFAYRSSTFETAPISWTRLLQADRAWAFPAGEPTALFTLAQYQSLGGQLLGASGRPILDPTQLTRVLGFYQSARSAGLLPASALQQQTTSETWESLISGRVDAAVAQYSTYASDSRARFITAAPLPTQSGDGISYASTLTWALTSADPTRGGRAGELLDWLSQPEFVGPWTEALGLLPPTSDALARWSEGEPSSLAALLVNSLSTRPSEETLATFGPALRSAVAAVLSEGNTPDEAALQAAQTIQSP